MDNSNRKNIVSRRQFVCQVEPLRRSAGGGNSYSPMPDPEDVCPLGAVELSVDAAPIGKEHALCIWLIDMVGGFILSIVTLPLWLTISVLVKMTSPGRVIYRQQRVGVNGRVFTLYKFRTMVEHAEKEWGLLPAIEDDVRITKVGRILRRTRLDELPQLINVLKGEMSLVGPRPENLHRVSMHKALQGARLAVRPGITGLAQVRSLYDLKPDHKLKYDYLYIQKRSVWLNLYILVKTIPVIFGKTGW